MTIVPLAGDDRGIRQGVSSDAARHSGRHGFARYCAARFIGKWEGFLPDAYLDTIAQPAVWTIGYGHTGGVLRGEHWSKAYARKVLAEDVKWAAAVVNERVTHKLSIRQRMALISFVFNLGPGALEGDLLAALNAGEFHRAGDMMLDYDHAGGVVVQGLLNRRRAERWMLLHPRARPRNPHRKDR